MPQERTVAEICGSDFPSGAIGLEEGRTDAARCAMAAVAEGGRGGGGWRDDVRTTRRHRPEPEERPRSTP
jgi:hypothetical protein